MRGVTAGVQVMVRQGTSVISLFYSELILSDKVAPRRTASLSSTLAAHQRLAASQEAPAVPVARGMHARSRSRGPSRQHQLHASSLSSPAPTSATDRCLRRLPVAAARALHAGAARPILAKQGPDTGHVSMGRRDMGTRGEWPLREGRDMSHLTSCLPASVSFHCGLSGQVTPPFMFKRVMEFKTPDAVQASLPPLCPPLSPYLIASSSPLSS